MNNYIKDFFNGFDLDVRKSRDARFMDQKVTPDVLYIVCICVLEYIKDDFSIEFTTNDIWESEFSNNEVKRIFNKTDLNNRSARNEYDKFFAQPLRMLAYSNVLTLQKRRKNYFKLNDLKIIEFLSYGERNCLHFINLYLEKVLIDSNIMQSFDSFFSDNTNQTFSTLKNSFVDFMIFNTSINLPTEPRRIFTKIINPMAYIRQSRGTKGGNMSEDVIGYGEIMYNRRNWRDVPKPKAQTRAEYRIQNIDNDEYTRFSMDQAKRSIRRRHNLISEVQDDYSEGDATQVHHIFPRNEFPQIEANRENLILLTPNQHFNKAHPRHNTRIVDSEYQTKCLLFKSESIKNSVEIFNDGFYSKEDFSFVLNTGFATDIFNPSLSFEEINRKIINI